MVFMRRSLPAVRDDIDVTLSFRTYVRNLMKYLVVDFFDINKEIFI